MARSSACVLSNVLGLPRSAIVVPFSRASQNRPPSLGGRHVASPIFASIITKFLTALLPGVYIFAMITT